MAHNAPNAPNAPNALSEELPYCVRLPFEQSQILKHHASSIVRNTIPTRDSKQSVVPIEFDSENFHFTLTQNKTQRDLGCSEENDIHLTVVDVQLPSEPPLLVELRTDGVRDILKSTIWLTITTGDDIIKLYIDASSQPCIVQSNNESPFLLGNLKMLSEAMQGTIELQEKALEQLTGVTQKARGQLVEEQRQFGQAVLSLIESWK